MSLYHKYRPQKLEDVFGNGSIIETLTADLNKKDKPHAFLIHGPVGCGKTTLGRIIARMLGCKGTDFKEVDSADFRGIDTVREIRIKSRHEPMSGDCIVFLIDECHKMTNDAQSALLKTLEDAPAKTYYILATTDPQKLLPTIKSRCAQYQVSPLDDRQMLKLLRTISRNEEKEIDREVLDQIILDSQGYPRNALQILDQIIDLDPDKQIDAAKRTAEIQSEIIELCRALIGKKNWKQIAVILSGLQDQDPEKIRRAILGYCNAILLKGKNDQAGIMIEQMKNAFYESGHAGLTFACYYIIET